MIGFEPGGDGPATDLRLKGLDVNPDFKRGRVESRYDRVDHLLHPFFQRCEERTGKAFGHRSHFLAAASMARPRLPCLASISAKRGDTARTLSWTLRPRKRLESSGVGEALDHFRAVMSLDHGGHGFISNGPCGG